jgi:glutathione S-transferase
MERKLYDLAAADERIRFSPYCWRVKMALAHKGLDVTTVPWRFIDKHEIAFAHSRQVPVLIDGTHVVSDSMRIADYLDERYPERPLFGSPQARAHACFIRQWTESIVFPAIFKQILPELFANLDVKDKAYFRTTREARLGMSLEAFSAGRDEALPGLLKTLQPLRLAVTESPFLGGPEPSFADYIVFGAFQWARCGAGRSIVPEHDRIAHWFGRMLDLYEGLGANAHRVPGSFAIPAV